MDNDGKLVYDKVDPTQIHIAKTIAPLFSSDINILGQIKADLEIFIDALEKKERLNLTYEQIFKDIIGTIEEIPEKIFRIVLLNKDTESKIKSKVREILGFINNNAGVNFRYIYNKRWNDTFNEDKTNTLINKVDDLLKILKKEQDVFAKEYLINSKLHPRMPNSLVRAKYDFNYLNLPKLTGQSGGYISNLMYDINNLIQKGGSNKSFYKKYMKYKIKYLNLQK
jgi:hypothetical protein